jgi:hypothetical protein
VQTADTAAARGAVAARGGQIAAHLRDRRAGQPRLRVRRLAVQYTVEQRDRRLEAMTALLDRGAQHERVGVVQRVEQRLRVAEQARVAGRSARLDEQPRPRDALARCGRRRRRAPDLCLDGGRRKLGLDHRVARRRLRGRAGRGEHQRDKGAAARAAAPAHPDEAIHIGSRRRVRRHRCSDRRRLVRVARRRRDAVDCARLVRLAGQHRDHAVGESDQPGHAGRGGAILALQLGEPVATAAAGRKRQRRRADQGFESVHRGLLTSRPAWA